MAKSRKEWEPRFLKALAKSGNATIAAKAAGVGRATVYRHYAADLDFAAAWEEAIDEAADMLEAVALKRATEGQSDRLLIFLLQAARPHKYRQGATVQPAKTHPSAAAPAKPPPVTPDQIMVTGDDGVNRPLTAFADA